MTETPQQYPARPASLQYGAPAPSKSNGLAIGSLVAGIVALLFCFIPFIGAISILIGIAAVVLGMMGLKKVPQVGGRGLAVAGVITGIAGALFAVIFLILTIAFFKAADDATDDLSSSLDEVSQQIQGELENMDFSG